MRPRFSEILLERRHELGLSLAQASKVLRLREDVLQAFEEGNYAQMPQTGYAQGMLSSYARYLGLNAREIVDLYQEEFYEFRHGTSSHELRRRTRDTQAGRGVVGYDYVNEEESRPKAYVQYRPLLPTSGGPAGDLGNFATVTPPRMRTPLPSQTGQIACAPTQLYQPRNNARAYTQHEEAPRIDPSLRTRRRMNRSDQTQHSASLTGTLYRRDSVSTHQVRPQEYVDDLRYDDQAQEFASASTLSGRRASRALVDPVRPEGGRASELRRRRQDLQRRTRAVTQTGLPGLLQAFFADRRRQLLAIVFAGAVVLSAILIFSVSSCMQAKTTPSAPTQNVAVQTIDSSAKNTQQNQSSSSTSQATTQTPSQTAASEQSQATSEVQETVVDIQVEEGQFTWLEITVDGHSEIADNVTGPWQKTFTVTDVLQIQVSNPKAVSVSKNGKRMEFAPRASGLGSLSIKGTPKPETATNATQEQKPSQ